MAHSQDVPRNLPPSVITQLRELDTELAEGDITQKGYDKKRTKLLAPYVQSSSLPTSGSSSPAGTLASSSAAANSYEASQDSPYRMTSSRAAAERAAAVRQALAKFQADKEGVMPMSCKRSSVSVGSKFEDLQVMTKPVHPPPASPDHDSAPPQLSLADKRRLLEQREAQQRELAAVAQNRSSPSHTFPEVGSSEGRAPSPVGSRGRQQQASIRPQSGATRAEVQSSRLAAQSNRPTPGEGKVSAKIQQLLNTLRRPKKNRKALEDYFTDDDKDDTPPEDPNAPKPVGPTMTPCASEPLQADSALPRNLEAAIQRYAAANSKAPLISQVEANGKVSVALTYGKLSSRSQKLAYTLLHKLPTPRGMDTTLKQGDRVALIFSAHEPGAFSVAFFGCLTAGLVPVAIEPPSTRDDPGGQQIGFLLGSLGISVAVTSEATVRSLPKDESTHHIVHFKGWPKLMWVTLDNLAKPPKDWSPPPRSPPDSPAYVEYKVDADGAVMGVVVERQGLLSHCRGLLQAMHYREGETVVCAVDWHRQTGFWHAVLAATYAGMNAVCILPMLARNNPLLWLNAISKGKASVTIASSSVLLAASQRTLKELRDVSLENIRALVVADGTSPWSLNSTDTFQEVFKSRGFQPEMFCPCASSSETLSLSLRRPGAGHGRAPTTGRGIMSISGLSYGVVRVEDQSSLSSVTLQDLGIVLPGSRVCVIQHRGPPTLCCTDEVGEICVSSIASGTHYWGLSGKSSHVFRVQPLQPNGKPLTAEMYVRSGLMGFIGPGGLVFVCGTINGLIELSGRRHNADDLISTVLAVEPLKFVYRQRLAVFSVHVLREERIVVVAEQGPGCSEEDAFHWMTNVLPAVESIHNTHLYSLALVPAGCLPKHSDGTVHITETRQRFIDGVLHPVSLLLCPHAAVHNLPKPYKPATGSTAAHIMGDAVTGARMAMASGKALEPLAEDRDIAGRYQYLSEVLRWRAQSTPDHILYTTLNERGQTNKTLTCSQLLKRADRAGGHAMDKAGLSSGDHVALLYPPGFDLVVAFYGCLLYGLIPVVIRPPSAGSLASSLPTVRMIVEVSRSIAILTTHAILRLFKSKEAGNIIDMKSFPPLVDTDDASRRKNPSTYRPPTAEMLAYLDFSVSTTGVLAGIKMSHTAATNLCRSLKLSCELYPSRTLGLCLDPYSGLGLVLWCLTGVYSGHHSVIVAPAELEQNPSLWLQAVSTHKIRDTFCSYSVLELCTRELGSGAMLEQLRSKQGIDLSCVRNCVVVAEERPRLSLTSAFCTLFAVLGLSPRSVSTSFGCRGNIGICTQGASQPDPSTVYVDQRALRMDRISLLERGSPHSLPLLECGKILPGVHVAIVNPDTKVPCVHNDLGEIWVASSHNGSGYYGLASDVNDALSNDHFRARMASGISAHTEFSYARTGFLGFIKHSTSKASATAADSGYDSLFVVGSLDEALMVHGYRYHAIDVETTIQRCHKNISEAAVFTWTKLLVAVVELTADESEALDVVPVVTSAVLDDHQIVVGIVVVVDPNTIPINSRSEKQRMHLRDRFLADELDPIYVAYNM